ncbi:MAG TPA: PIN domain-containing protein [Candidatus Lokiarchaeia archaeon]
MHGRICFDAGPIYLYYRKNPPEQINQLIDAINKQKSIAYVPNVILIEVYKHLCVIDGKDFATSCINSFLLYVKTNIVSLTPEIIIKAGSLKCQYRTELSYNDCIAITVALQNKAILHTTEKNLPKIKSLEIITYDF